MKHATESGLGPVCQRRAQSLPVVERDLFGYDAEKAAAIATEWVRSYVDALAAAHHAAVRHQFKAARLSLGVE